MKKLFTVVSLLALFLVGACKKAEVFPVSANDTVRVDTVRVDTVKVDTVNVGMIKADTTENGKRRFLQDKAETTL